MFWLILAALFIAALVYDKRRKEKRDAQYDMRFPELYSDQIETLHARGFVDFERMLLVEETSDYDYAHVRVFHLRRCDGPVWEAREEEASRERSWKHLEEAKKGPDVGRDFTAEEKALRDNPWTPAQFPTLETAYQLFLRHHDAAVVFRSPVDGAVAHDFVRGSVRPKVLAKR